jgi:hypothetical protein
MFNLISIIDRLLTLLVKWSIDREQAKAQRERDALHKNPADWFADHFDGLPNSNDNQTNKTNSTNTTPE